MTLEQHKDYKILEVPKPGAILVMSPEPFKTAWGFPKMPNRWRRFWYWALLGWRFERVEDQR